MEPPRAQAAIALGAIILAAGRSQRMGRPKLLLPWGKSSMIGHLLDQWRGLRARQIAVVCASGDDALAAELDRLNFPAVTRVYNPAPERGMFSSIQCAAIWPGWDKRLTHWAIVLGDQPHVREETLRKVLDFSANQPEKVCQPRQGGHGRHPVVLPRPAFSELAKTRSANLHEFLKTRAAATAFCELDDAGLGLDIDRPEDYDRAIELHKAGLSPKP